jgi:hypothetical protein
MVRRSVPYSFNAAARAFCRSEADSLPTSKEAVAWPNFSEPARRSRSSQCSVISAVSSRRVSSGPTAGYAWVNSAFGPVRWRVIFPRSPDAG